MDDNGCYSCGHTPQEHQRDDIDEQYKLLTSAFVGLHCAVSDDSTLDALEALRVLIESSYTVGLHLLGGGDMPGQIGEFAIQVL